MTLSKKIYLTCAIKIDGGKLTMEEMIYWSDHNVFAYINTLMILKTK